MLYKTARKSGTADRLLFHILMRFSFLSTLHSILTSPLYHFILSLYHVHLAFFFFISILHTIPEVLQKKDIFHSIAHHAFAVDNITHHEWVDSIHEF